MSRVTLSVFLMKTSYFRTNGRTNDFMPRNGEEFFAKPTENDGSYTKKTCIIKIEL